MKVLMWAWFILILVALSVKNVMRFANKSHQMKKKQYLDACSASAGIIAQIISPDESIVQGFEKATAVAATLLGNGRSIDSALLLAAEFDASVSHKELSGLIRTKLIKSRDALEKIKFAFTVDI